MNTPKLTSIISSTLGNTDAARNGRQANPGHGLDFSQLLGERRSQSAVAPPNARSNDSGAAVRRNDNRAENAPRPENARPASQGEARTTEQTSTRSSDNASTRSSRSENTAAAEESNSPGPAQTQASSSRSGQAASNDASQTTGNTRQAAGEQHGDTAGASAALAANSPAEPAAAQTAETAGAPAGALLAEHAAEAGLAAMIAGQLAAPVVEAAAGNAPPAVVAVPTVEATSGNTRTDAHPVAGAAPLVAGQTIASAPGAPTLQMERTATASTSTGLGREALAVGIVQPGTAGDTATGSAPLMAGHTVASAPGTAAAGAAGSARGGANTGLAAALNPAAGEPASGTAAATTPLNTIAAAIGTATEGSPAAAMNPATLSPAQALAINTQPAETLAPLTPAIADTAAARSLQEFTAMVAAARATSGTTLQAVAQAQPSAPFAGQVPGLAPAGIFGLQAPAAGLPGSPGIAAPLNSPQWPTEFGRQFISIAQAANGLGQVAELRLDPPDLGPLRITINLNDNVAHAVFSSPHASVRQTVENALPQLQQMLEQAGISLGQANVNDQQQSGNPFQNASGNAARHASAGGNSADGGDAPLTAEELRASRPANPNTLLDTFA